MIAASLRNSAIFLDFPPYVSILWQVLDCLKQLTVQGGFSNLIAIL